MTKKDVTLPTPPTHRRWWRVVAGTLWIAGAAANRKNLQHLDPANVRLGEMLVLASGTWLIVSGLSQVPTTGKCA